MEASTGIEPVYTDLQSAASPLRQLAKALRTRDFVVCGLISSYFGRHKPKDFRFVDFDASCIQKQLRHIKTQMALLC